MSFAHALQSNLNYLKTTKPSTIIVMMQDGIAHSTGTTGWVHKLRQHPRATHTSVLQYVPVHGCLA